MAKLKPHEMTMLKHLIHAKHVYGLPIAEGLEVYIYYEANGFLFNANDRIFGLGYDVITDLDVRTETEIQSAYVSSAGGAVAGGMMFGPVGALIGGRTQNVTSSVNTEYLIITYIKDGELAYLCFELTFRIGCHGNGNVRKLNSEARSKINYGARDRTMDLSKSNDNKVVPVISKYVINEDLGRKVVQLAFEYDKKLDREMKTRITLILLFIMTPIIAAILCIIICLILV